MTDEEKMAVELDEKIENEMLTELEEKDKLLKEKEERYLRMYAEFENYKKRTEKEKQNGLMFEQIKIFLKKNEVEEIGKVRRNV